MRCPFCASDDTRVIDSRLGDSGDSVRRRRACQECSQRFTTSEQVVFEMPQVIKSNDCRENFDETKLRKGITRALEKRPIAMAAVEGVVNRIMRKFARKGVGEIDAKQIGEAVMTELRQLDEVAYVRFASVYRRFEDIKSFSAEVKRLETDL